MDIPLIDQVRIQAQVLVPLVKALQAELGEQRADAIVRQALGARYRGYGERWWRAQHAADVGEAMARAFEGFAAGDARDVDAVRKTPDAFDAADLGFLLTCSADFAWAEGYGAGVTLTGTQTIMQAASHCEFRHALEPRDEATG